MQPLAVQQLQAGQREHMEGHRSVPLGACLSCAKHELSRAARTSEELVLLEADISKEPVNFASDHLIWQAMSSLTLTTS